MTLMMGAVCGISVGPVLAQIPEVQTVESSTKQFIVSMPKGVPANPRPDNAPQLVNITPEIVAVSVERIKRDYLRLLGLQDNWQSKIIFAINPQKPANETIVVFSKRYSDGWKYHIELPPWMEEVKFVRLIVTALLQERANRSARDRSVQLPLWLTEGFTLYLINDHPRELLLQAQASTVVPINAWIDALASDPTSSSRAFFPIDSSPVAADRRRIDPIELLMRYFAENKPMTFNELNFPEEMTEDSEEWLRFQFSANLFVLKLFKLQNGKNSLLRMINSSSQVLNWQTAFLDGFSNHFETLLDVDKWWTLITFELETIGIFKTETGATFYALSQETAIARLRELLLIESTSSPDNPGDSGITYVRLQDLIQGPNSEETRNSLELVFEQLTVLSNYCDPGLALLINRYAKTLGNYLNRRIDDTVILRLNELDALLEEIAPNGVIIPQPMTSAQIEAFSR